MSKINNAISEIRTIDEMANKDQWMNQIHPLVKLFLTIFYIALVVSLSKYEFWKLLGMAIYPFVTFQIGEVSFKDALKKLRIVLPVVCIVGVFNPFFDREVITYIGTIPITGGVVSMITLMMKGIFTVLATYLLVATTTIEKICYALSLIHVPKIFITQILLIYRYITVLLSEFHRMSQAYALRAPGQKGINYKVWGSFVGQLLLRSMDRAEIIYESMTLRGFQGDFYYAAKTKCKSSDIIYLIVWTVLFLLFRNVAVLFIVGNIFM